jgi:hypothetical protein
MKNLLTTFLLSVIGFNVNSQVVRFEMLDYQNFYIPSNTELNDALRQNTIVYETNPITGKISAWEPVGGSIFLTFDFNNMTATLDLPRKKINGVIMSILSEEENNGFPSQFTVLWDGEDDEEMFGYTFDIFGHEVFLNFYEKDTHPWFEGEPWVPELHQCGLFTKHFYFEVY